MTYDVKLAGRVRQALSGEPDVSEQPMFGGLAFFVRGHLAVAVSGRGGLVVRVPPDRREALRGRPHAQVAIMAGRPWPGWLRVAAQGVRTGRDLSGWVAPSAAYARSLAEARSAAGADLRDADRAIAAFDGRRLWDAMDARRRAHGLSWAAVARQIWQLSWALNAQRQDAPVSPSTLARLGERPRISCQHALFVLRWLGEPPERYLAAEGADVATAPLPACAADQRLRWDLRHLYVALDTARRQRGHTWADLARTLGLSPGQLTALRTARYGTGMDVAMAATQWLGRPAADFVYAAAW
jgi:hypothetical protein